MKERFIHKNFRDKTIAIITVANRIIEEYAAQGFSLTVRQLYYQFVARDMIANTMRSYKNLASIINDGRLAGYIDWSAIEDRTRNLESRYHEESPSGAIENALKFYNLDLWENQPRRVEVWIEKEALTGVIAKTCRMYDVPYFACRGYVSQSETYAAYQRSLEHPLTILHLGDHDPSGIDMTRDNLERLAHVMGGDVELKRIALNMAQVEEYDPPPNPAKVTDSRWADYMGEFGPSSWELDALEPSVINKLIETEIALLTDTELMSDRLVEQKEDRDTLRDIIDGLE